MDPADETRSTGVTEWLQGPFCVREEPIPGAPIKRDPPDVETAGPGLWRGPGGSLVVSRCCVLRTSYTVSAEHAHFHLQCSP